MGRAFEVRKAAMAKTSAAKAKVYSRYGREIFMAAKSGIPDPEMNVSLKRMVEEARSKQVPADVIKRAIEKAKGGSEESYHTVVYEGFGPGASSFIVECLTDNDNRSVSEVRNCFTKSKGKMGVSGSVAHAYDYVGILSFAFADEEKIMEILFEQGVDIVDIENEEGNITITLNPSDLHQAKESLEESFGTISFDISELSYLPHDYVSLDGDDLSNFEKLVTMLDAVDDVKEVYHNVSIES